VVAELRRRPCGHAFKQTGLRDTPSGSSSDYAADPVSTALRAPTTRRGLPAARTSVEYLGANRRVVTIYGVNDRTIQSRIVYTRRR
jgi:hypothetical protein